MHKKQRTDTDATPVRKGASPMALDDLQETMIEKPASAELSPTISEPSRGKKVTEPSNNGDWEPLTSLKAAKSQKPPTYINNAAQHLIETGKISAQDCPIRAKHVQNYLLHTEPVHPNNKRFKKKREIGKLWLQTSYGTSKETYNIACWLLRQFGVNPSTVLVSTNPS